MRADAFRRTTALPLGLLVSLLLSTVQSVEAQPAETSPTRPPLPVFIAGDVHLDQAAVTEAFATMPALGLVILPGEPAAVTPVVLVESVGAELRVVYRRAPGLEIARTLTPPQSPTLAAEAVALVIINLVHDETGDLLSLLAPEEAAPEQAATDDTSEPEAPPPTRTDDEPATEPEVEASTEAAPPAPPAREVSATLPAAVDEEPAAPGACSERANHWRVGVDLLPMVGTSSVRAGREAVRGFSLNLAGGLSRGLHGVEIGGALNVQRGFACGVQIAGAVNLVLGPVQGLQIAPVNVALGRVDGVQIGVVNVAHDVRGVQLGLLNISRNAAAPIGLLSIVTRGRTEVHVTSSESGMILAGVSHGGRVIHNLYAVGARLGSAGPRFVLAAGLGARLFTHERVSMDLDAITLWILRGDQNRQSTMFQLRLPIAVRIIDRVSVFIAPTYQWFFSQDAGERTQMPAALVTTYRDASDARGRVLGWPGINVGARVHL